MKVESVLELEVYTQANAFDKLKHEWNDLLIRSQANTIFNTWEWHSTWWNIYQPGDLWIVICRDNSGKLIGIAPWFIDQGRVVRFIGCEDVTDYLDLIIDKKHIDIVLGHLANFLKENCAMYDHLDLCNIPAASSTLEKLPHLLQNNLFEVRTIRQDVCPIIEVPPTWEEYLQSLDKKQRHEIRRKLRRAEGVPDKIDWYTVDSSQNIQVEIERFFLLMAASDENKQLFLQNEAHKAFFRHMIPLVFEKGWLRLNFLTINDEPTAAYLNFVYDNQLLIYNSGLKIENYGHLSPGILLLVNNIQYAIDQGYKVVDFLRGNETYKYRMGGKDTEIFKLSAWCKQDG